MTGSLCFEEIHAFSFFKTGMANFAHIQLCNPRSLHHFCPLGTVGVKVIDTQTSIYAAVDFCSML